MFRKIVIMIALVTASFGASEAAFPKNWNSFQKVTTPLSVIGALPDCNADVSSLPAIYQETVATYCAIKPGGPGAVEILVSPSAKSSFAKRNGKYPDGAEMILHLKDLKVLFVTTYKGNEPFYSIYTESGQDAAGADGSGLSPNDCRTCHTGYGAFCLNGQCATQK